MSVPDWKRSWSAAVLIGALLLGAAGTLALALEIGSPFGGYVSYSVALEDIGYISEKTPGWWPIYHLGADVQGTLVTVEGQPYTPHAWRLFAGAETGSQVVLGLMRSGGGAVDLAVPVLTFDAGHFLDLKLPDVIVALSFWLLGFIVLRSAPQQPTNRIFALLAAIITAHRLLNTHNIVTDNRFVPNFFEAGLLLASAFMGATAFHFAWLYPSPLPNRPRRLIRLFYLAGLVLAVAGVLARVTWWPPGVTPPNVMLTTFAYQGLLFLYLLGVLAIFARLAYSAVHQRSTRREKRILLLTFAGMLLALPFLILSAGDVLPGLEPNLYWRNLDLRYLFIAIPLALALAIIRYQNLTVPPPGFLFVAVLGASALMANLAAWLWQIARPELIAANERSPFLPFFLAIFAASLFWSMQTTWRGWFGRFFERERLNYAATRDLGRRLRGASDLASLPQALAQAIAEELQLESVAVWQVDGDGEQFVLTARAGEMRAPLPQALAVPEAAPAGHPLRLAPGQPLPRWLAPLPADAGVEIIAPLYGDQEPVALLGFGRRWDEEIFDETDLIVLELIAQQALLYLQVAQQIEALRQVPSQVSAAQERERTLLAAELHDTIQQFLGRLPFFLAASKEAMAEDPEEAARLLERSLRDIEEAARTVQRIRQNLAPSQLEHSLTRSLSVLAAYTEQRYGIEVPLEIRGEPDAATDLETRHALYRVIQHALDNAVAHSGAQRAVVTLQSQDGRISFVVQDNGCGATPEALRRARAAGHFGLQSMRARVEACGGQVDFETADGQGMRVAGWVPAPK